MDRSTYIRPAVPSDAEAIGEVHVRGWRASLLGLVPESVLAAVSIEERARTWRARLEDAAPGERRVWVVEEGASIAGVAVTAPTRDADDDSTHTSELMMIYVRPESWRMGYGSALLAHAVGDLRRRGWRELSLWVVEGNTRARRFYERAGFEVDGSVKVVQRADAVLSEIRYRLRLD